MATINSLDDLKDGQLYRPKDVAPLFPGSHAKKVIALCNAGELEYVHEELAGMDRWGNPRGRYWISGSAVKAWRRRNTVKKAA